MPLKRSSEPFSSRDWLFELKYDGFRALAEIESGRCRLVSRNGNAFASFHELALRIGRLFPKNRVVMDGEIVCLDKHGRPQFKNLLFRCGEPSFIAFDLLYDNEQGSAPRTTARQEGRTSAFASSRRQE